ncbi:MAG TPA: hypothetical protein VFV50_10785 [Bdellovibrionales bacterium]|nr:hypothetical protein [Bdellovibrionales bacterium]
MRTLILLCLLSASLSSNAQNRAETALEGGAAQTLLKSLEAAGSIIECEKESFHVCGTVVQDLLCTKDAAKKMRCQFEAQGNDIAKQVSVSEAKAKPLYEALSSKIKESCMSGTCTVSASIIQCFNYLQGPDKGFQCAILH